MEEEIFAPLFSRLVRVSVELVSLLILSFRRSWVCGQIVTNRKLDRRWPNWTVYGW